MKTFSLIITIAVFLLPHQLLLARDQTQADQSSSSNSQQQAKETEIKYGEIIPEAVEFAKQRNAIEDYFQDMQDVAEIDIKIKDIEVSLNNVSEIIKSMKELKSHNDNKINELIQTVNDNNRSLESIIDSLAGDITKLGNWRDQLLADKASLNQRVGSMPPDETSARFESFIKQVSGNIDDILGRVGKKIVPLIQAQERAASLQIIIIGQKSELNNLIDKNKELYSYPILFSPAFINQLKSLRWAAFLDGFNYIRWTNKQYFDQVGPVALYQVMLSVLVIFLIYRKRRFFAESERWRFLAKKPFSAGIYIGFVTFVPLLRYYGIIPTWELILAIIWGGSFVLIVQDFINMPWKRHFIYGLYVLIILFGLFDVITLPIPIFRLYVVFISLIALIFCLRWAAENGRSEKQSFYSFMLILLSLILGVIIVEEILGYGVMAEHIFKGFVILSSKLLVWILYIQIILGGFEWLFKNPLRQLTPTNQDVNSMVHRIAVIIYFLFGLYLITSMFMIWGVEQDFHDTLKVIFSYEFNLSIIKINLGLLVTLLAILYLTYFVSLILKHILMNAGGLSKQIAKGVRLSIAQLFQYIIITIGFVIILNVIGLKLTQITIILSALGIGIGFGLQNIVNDFFSGLILLFERPIRVGDIIEMQGRRAEVKHIGLRSTVILTYDEQEVIVPNSDLVSKEVTNLTLSSRVVRIKIPVGVAYGSDVNLVLETLITCAKGHKLVARIPDPQAIFMGFGDSALNFELRVWIIEADQLIQVQSELLQEIDRHFRKYKIEIAFPQRDLHIRTIHEPIKLEHSEDRPKKL